MKLYEISNEFQKVVDLIENCDEMTPELIEQLNAVSDDASAEHRQSAYQHVHRPRETDVSADGIHQVCPLLMRSSGMMKFE